MELSENMEKYSLQGFYLYNGDQGDLKGSLKVDPKSNEFETRITDFGSRVPDQIIKGILQNVGDRTRLGFFKYPQDDNLANLIYMLDKPAGKDFSGTYNGEWGALPYKADIVNEELGLVMVKTDMSICSVGDKAEITLSKIA